MGIHAWKTMAGAGWLLLLAGCSLFTVREQAQSFHATAILAGRVEATAGGRPLVVAAWRMQDGRVEVLHATRLHEPGGYELIVGMGEARVFAFVDADDDGQFDAGEAAGEYRGPAGPQILITPAVGGIVTGLDFTLTASATPALPPGSRLLAPRTPRPSSQVGALLDLDDPRFGPEAGRQGYWAPVDFYREQGGNIYFLEPYDPARIPVLFVHGAQGSPQDFRGLVARLDRSRYQAWFFQYPSGVAVDSMAHLLYWKLLNLQFRYAVPRLYLTAHSMGGLVTQRFLEQFGAQFPQIRLFVSIATPWGGDPAAASGVRYSPAVLPVWQDLQPQGRFLQGLFQRPLPPHIDYYLFFAHHGSPGLWRPNNDGTVTLSSQLRPAAQAAARQVFGFDEGHVGVLDSPALAQRYAAVLQSLTQPRVEGRLVVSAHYAGHTGPAPIALLRLRPQDGDGEIVTALGQAHEIALAPGTYRAELYAYGYRAATPMTTLQVEAGRSSGLTVALRPEPVLWGYLVEPAQPGAQAAGQYRRPAGERLRRAKLSGPSGTRQVDAVADGADLAMSAYLAGRDHAFDGFFSFVGLTPGRHHLQVERADGRRWEQEVVVGSGGVSEPVLVDLP